MAKLVSKTYGDALFELAEEENSLDTVLEEIEAVQKILKDNVELMRLLDNPKITIEEKVSVIENIFKGRVSDTTVGFLVLVLQKGRYQVFDSIFEYFVERVKEYKNIGIACVTSAIPLSDSQKKQVEEKLLLLTKYTSFEITYQTDPSLIGGIVIRIGDRVVDGSVKTKLAKLAKQLSA